MRHNETGLVDGQLAEPVQYCSCQNHSSHNGFCFYFYPLDEKD